MTVPDSIFDSKGDDLFRLAKDRVIGSPALGCDIDADLHMAMRRKFYRVGKKVLQDLLQTFVIALHEPRQVGRKMDVEWKIFRFGDVPEVAFDVFPQPVECNLLDLHRDRSGLDLGQVENVIDEVEQIRTGRVDVSRELDLPVRKVTGNVLGKLLTEN